MHFTYSDSALWKLLEQSTNKNVVIELLKVLTLASSMFIPDKEILMLLHAVLRKGGKI